MGLGTLGENIDVQRTFDQMIGEFSVAPPHPRNDSANGC